MDEEPDNAARSSERWVLIRDAGVLQVKLVVDGLRDLLLVPASLIAAIASLITSDNGRPGPQFYELLEFGKKSERWIDLFAAQRNAPGTPAAELADSDKGLDDIVRRMESFVVEEYRRGGVTAQARERIDRALDALQKKRPK